MKYVHLRGTSLKPSQIGFGCASIMGRIGKRQALRALQLAYDAGVTHFDVARSYGYGEAENVLGGFIKGKRDKICVATKFGIRPTRAGLLLRASKPLIRKTLSVFPGLKKRMQHQSQTLISGGHFSISDARDSLETSLRALQTDRIDIYLLHDCTEHDELSDDLFHFLDNCVREGKILYYGVASDASHINKILAQRPRNKISVLQFASNNFQYNSVIDFPFRKKAFIIHSPYGGQNGLSKVHRVLQENNGIRDDFSHRLGVDLSNIKVVGQLLLSHALSRSEQGVVLCSMFNEQHIKENAGLAESNPFTYEQIMEFELLIKLLGDRHFCEPASVGHQKSWAD